MSRRHRAEKREVHTDPKFGDASVSKFMNYIMYDGKKSAAEKIVYGALDRIEGKLRKPPIDAFKEALDNVMPSIEVRSRRVGGATYQVPVEVRPERRVALAMRRALAPDGMMVFQLNGAAAGQTVFHYHAHLLPRTAGSELRLHGREAADRGRLGEVAARIAAALA
jgi:ribosomal protein S7